MEGNISNQEQNPEQAKSCGAAIIYGIIAFVISLLFALEYKIPEVTTFRRTTVVILAVIVGMPLGTIGGAIGDALRKAAHPDAILTTGGMTDILKTKLFWAIGPQLIGVCIGSFIGAQLTASLIVKHCFS